MNNATIEGVVTSEPQKRYTTQNQTPVAEFYLKPLSAGEEHVEASVTILGKRADELGELPAGTKVVVEGRLQLDKVDGLKDKKISIIAKNITPISVQAGPITTKPVAQPAQQTESDLMALYKGKLGTTKSLEDAYTLYQRAITHYKLDGEESYQAYAQKGLELYQKLMYRVEDFGKAQHNYEQAMHKFDLPVTDCKSIYDQTAKELGENQPVGVGPVEPDYSDIPF